MMFATTAQAADAGYGAATQGKLCLKCGVWHSWSEFHKDRSKPDGHRTHCKTCCRDYYNTNRTLIAKRQEMYRTANRNTLCLKAKRYRKANRAASISRDRQYRIANREAISAKKAAYYRDNTERILSRHEEYNKAVPQVARACRQRRRARLYEARGYRYTTAQHIAWRWEMWGGKCWKCGQPAEATDHVIPLCDGGAHWPANLRPICKSCNSRRPKELVWSEIVDAATLRLSRSRGLRQ